MSDEDEWTRADSERLAAELVPIVDMIRSLDRDALDAAIREFDRYDAAAPMLDPTGWMSTRDQSDRARARIKAIRDCHVALTEADP